MINTTRPFLTLVRRELWEHGSLVWAPLAMALTIIVVSLVSGMVKGSIDIDLGEDRPLPELFGDAEKQRGIFSLVMAGLVLPQLLVAFVVVFFYLLDGLFTERRDRSILFWKSLPVSDAKTVLSKLFVALVAVPLWSWALSLVVGLVVFGVLATQVSGTPAAGLGTWHGGTWLTVQAAMLGKMAIAALWYLPVAGWLLLVSVLAKRAPFLWATLPFLVLSLAERIALGSNVVGAMVAQRLFGFREEVSLMSEFPLLASPALWIGVAVGAALVYAAIRVRRRSDDS
jgi:ABC-2 type transport system permease protein